MDENFQNEITYLSGCDEMINLLQQYPSKQPFDENVVLFLEDVSKRLMSDSRSRYYSDVVTFAFWIRLSSIRHLNSCYKFTDEDIHLGRGVAFHIAPSNVAVNFAYSLVAGLITGNKNIVRVPSRDFPQVEIIVDAINASLSDYPEMKPYVVLIRYERDKAINDYLSSIADTRIIWGGDNTINELRKSPLPPRSTEITFADRYSIAIIDSDVYMATDDKNRIAIDFYNDTYISDQNACTSPRAVIWVGKSVEEAQKRFWEELYKIVINKYTFQDLQGVNKLVSTMLVASHCDESKPDNGSYGARLIQTSDNVLFRVAVDRVDNKLMDYKNNSGFFYEYICDNIWKLKSLLDDNKCQTVGVLGDVHQLDELLSSGIKGVDRVVPLGHTMDFGFIWDGYDLMHSLTRCIRLSH